MNIVENLLTINSFSRPGWRLPQVLAIVYHWTANPGASAAANRNFFESRKEGRDGYGSAHYIIGLKGEIIRDIPEREVAFHVGSSQIDPASKKVYTDLARDLFGPLMTSPKSSPNFATIGIELCPLDLQGEFSAETIVSAIQLGADLCSRYKLDPLSRVLTHHDVVGWKDCPRLWVNQPQLFEAFKTSIKARMG
jgi:N-acetylmuramoyl-L-alanine amidase